MSPGVALIWSSVASTWRASDDLFEKVKRSIPCLLQDKVFLDTLEMHLIFQEAVIKVSFSHQEYISTKVGNMTCHFSRSLVLTIVDNHSCLMTFNHFLAIADTLRSRVHFLVTGLVEDMLQKWPVSMAEKVKLLLACMDEAAKRLSHDEYFNATKSLYLTQLAECCNSIIKQ